MTLRWFIKKAQHLHGWIHSSPACGGFSAIRHFQMKGFYKRLCLSLHTPTIYPWESTQGSLVCLQWTQRSSNYPHSGGPPFPYKDFHLLSGSAMLTSSCRLIFPAHSTKAIVLWTGGRSEWIHLQAIPGGWRSLIQSRMRP